MSILGFLKRRGENKYIDKTQIRDVLSRLLTSVRMKFKNTVTPSPEPTAFVEGFDKNDRVLLKTDYPMIEGTEVDIYFFHLDQNGKRVPNILSLVIEAHEGELYYARINGPLRLGDMRADYRLPVGDNRYYWDRVSLLFDGKALKLIDVSGGGASFETKNLHFEKPETIKVILSMSGEVFTLAATVLQADVYRGVRTVHLRFDHKIAKVRDKIDALIFELQRQKYAEEKGYSSSSGILETKDIHQRLPTSEVPPPDHRAK
ncbi:MAG: PilZ domain-containing protein [Deltaproteobacteria bacterium]|nr:PilZ domain-containing protein [Deltaproteobacteria bacterium]